ncbi:MAG: TetR/AcrR family transcriptional regulator [Deltaproteobacteria bacterium]|nr:TetR/AcrR family transcriptional regulator [Deltaproteobacteria bacterium]
MSAATVLYMPQVAHTPPPPPLPEPKQARAVATRNSLLEATITCLARSGYAGTTTTEIVREAGVSQGALFRYFPTRTQLLGAAIADLFERFVRDYDGAFQAAARGRSDRIAVAIDLLWQVFTAPPMHAVFEVYLAARTDADLAAAIAPALARHRQNMLAEARALFPELAATPDFELVILGVIATLQGVALQHVALPDRDATATELRFVHRICLRELRGLQEEALAP